MSVSVTAAPRRNYWLFLAPAVFLVIAILLGWGFTRDPSEIGSVLIGKPVPQMNLPGLPGVQKDGAALPGLADDDLIGKGVTIVNVFASWCVPCREEHPALMQLARMKTARLVAINYKDDPAKAAGFLAELGNPFSAAGADPHGRTAIEWGVYGVPETFIIANDGTIIEKFVGPIKTKQRFLALIDAIEQAKKH